MGNPDNSELIGRTIGRFRIDALIGEGGMGRVYRAFDPTLSRAVAVKFLPQNLIGDRDRLDRFVREARTASSLNHPNVVTIYEIGSADSLEFIAMELLEGETLRERLTRGKLDLRRSIDTIGQVADGVAAAHAAGVVHRDLKPENIVITKAGFVKILDFGLAKLREAPAPEDGITAKRTDPGTVLGSVGYMSPEQSAGHAVDHRTDIFSLGCILYESIAGRRAFSGDSSIDTLHKIIYDDPAPIRELAPDTPAELQRIIRKCLAKDPDARYQSAKDLAIDLHDLRREVDSAPRAAAGAQPAPQKRALWIGAIAIAILVIAAIAIPMWRRSAPVAVAAPMAVSRITVNGNVIGAAVSPDGEYIAYAYSDAGKHSLFVRQLATSSTLQIVPPTAFGLWGMSFTADSRSIDYAVKSSSDPSGALFQIPILGGTPRKLLTGIDSSVSFSPDGKKMAFTRGNSPSAGQSAIVVANADGTGEKVLVSKTMPNFFVPIFWGCPSWSPDGKLIASPLGMGHEFTLVAIGADDGREQRLSPDRWAFVGAVSWMHDMKGLLVVGTPIGGSSRQVWSITYPDGHRGQLTNDLFDYRNASLSTDDQSLITVAADQSGSVWLTPLEPGVQPVKLSSGKYDGIRGVAASKDTIVFTTLDTGKWNLVSVDMHGNDRHTLTPSTTEGMAPVFSPDGQFLVFSMPRERDWCFARMNRDGTDIRVIAPVVPAGRSEGEPFITPDGRTIVFSAAPEGQERVYRMDMNGGPAVPVASAPSYGAAISPDGKLLAYIQVAKIYVAPLAGGPPVKVFENLSPNTYSMIRWTADGKGLLHTAAANDRKNVWLLPLDGSPTRPVTSFDDEYVLGFDVVPGGKALVVVRGVLSRDAVLIRNFH